MNLSNRKSYKVPIWWIIFHSSVFLLIYYNFQCYCRIIPLATCVPGATSPPPTRKKPFIPSTPPIILPAEEGQHNATIIFIHGEGNTAEDWAYQIRKIQQPYEKIILPQANEITLVRRNGTAVSWFEKGPNGIIELKRSSFYMQKLIDEEIMAGIPSERILVAGFERGGAIAFYSALTYPKRLAGIVGCSTWLPMRREIAYMVSTQNEKMFILQLHGTHDSVVPFAVGYITSKIIFKEITNRIFFRRLEDVNHNISSHGWNQIQDFVHRRFNPHLYTPVTVKPPMVTKF